MGSLPKAQSKLDAAAATVDAGTDKLDIPKEEGGSLGQGLMLPTPTESWCVGALVASTGGVVLRLRHRQRSPDVR